MWQAAAQPSTRLVFGGALPCDRARPDAPRYRTLNDHFPRKRALGEETGNLFP